MPILAPVTLGENVKAARRQNLMTQQELAKKAGISHRALVNIEKDNLKTEPQFRTIKKLADALDVEPSDLLED
ncbi:MAG: helix-turn-helix domain-containing protein [Actinomycetota bacterium]|nr:helix-turn-helix domain-containing protein [Actinomycetota bacterium]